MKLAVTFDEVVAIFIYMLQPIFVLGADHMHHIRRKIVFCCKLLKSLACGPHGFGTCLELRSFVDFTLLVSSLEEPEPVPYENYIRPYWWCSPARIGMAKMEPERWTARCKGASFCNAKCVRA
jgi:hypothetical protein